MPKRIGRRLRCRPRHPLDDAEALQDMFGIGCWKYAPEAAEKLLSGGLEKKADGWYFKGEPFTITLTYLAETGHQAGRGVQSAYDQLTKFGLNCTLLQESDATWNTNGSTGNYEIAGYCPPAASPRTSTRRSAAMTPR
jgi:peptide/nickel transport system substrate-binding protein